MNWIVNWLTKTKAQITFEYAISEWMPQMMPWGEVNQAMRELIRQGYKEQIEQIIKESLDEPMLKRMVAEELMSQAEIKRTIHNHFAHKLTQYLDR